MSKKSAGKRSNYWENAANRKSFFDQVAQKMQFDPLVPENWYSVTREIILQFEVTNIYIKYIKIILKF